MYYLLVTIMVITGLLFILSVMLMTPKGGLGFGIGGVSGGNEYGSKKSIEYTLKKVSIISGIIFLVVIFILPYIK